jgi:hypothetical protein
VSREEGHGSTLAHGHGLYLRSRQAPTVTGDISRRWRDSAGAHPTFEEAGGRFLKRESLTSRTHQFVRRSKQKNGIGQKPIEVDVNRDETRWNPKNPISEPEGAGTFKSGLSSPSSE